MSARWSVRTDGSPYVAFGQDDWSGMNLASGFQSGMGLTRMDLEFALHSLPQKFASDEEAHPLWTFRNASNFATLMGLYVTPSGRVVGLGPDGTGPFTRIDTVSPDGAYHVASLVHNGLAGVTTLTVDGGTPIAPASTPIFVLPPLGQFILFNGSSGLTRCSVSVRAARAYGPTDIGGDPPMAEWDMTETQGFFLNPGIASSPAWGFANLQLTAQFFGPTAFPWGSVPSTDVRLNFDWRLRTPWTRSTHAPTAWQQSKVTWPS